MSTKFTYGDKVKHATLGTGIITAPYEHFNSIVHFDNLPGDCRRLVLNEELTKVHSDTSREPLLNILDGEYAEQESKKQTSERHNQGKIQTREIDPDFILGIGEVLTKSRAKYAHFNWQKDTAWSTPYESLMRHLMAFQKGEDYDKESLCHHLLHCATNIMFLYYYTKTQPQNDDRGFKSLTNTKSCDKIVAMPESSGVTIK
jgi:hypothetical protein